MSDVATTRAGTRDRARQSIRIGVALWMAALAILGTGVFWLGIPAMFDPGSPDFMPAPDFFAFALAAFGTLHLGRGLLASARHGKYGASTLEARPAVAGQVYRGRIRTDRALDVTGPYTIRLLCESQSVSHGDESLPSSKHRVPVWEVSTTASAAIRSSAGIPFEFRIPADALPNRNGPSVPGQAIFWTLSISAPMAGLHYRETFPIDVGTGSETGDEPARDGPRKLADAFAGEVKPELRGMRIARFLAPVAGLLLIAAGTHATVGQWMHSRYGVALTGKVIAINRPALDVALDGGGTARVAYITKNNAWQIGQPVQVTCLKDGADLRACRMDTASDRWIDGLGNLAVGTLALLFGGWLWHRRRRRAFCRDLS